MSRSNSIRAYVAAASFAVALMSGAFAAAKTTPTVTIDNDAFNPKSITIAAGQTVIPHRCAERFGIALRSEAATLIIVQSIRSCAAS